MSRKTNTIFTAVSLSVYIFMAAFCITSSAIGGFESPGLFFAVLTAVTSFTCAVLCRVFVKSVDDTVYSYKNIALIAAILFITVFAVVFMASYIRSLNDPDVSLTHIARVMINFPRHFSYYAVFVMVAVCVMLGISNVALIRHEGFHLHNALSLLLAVLYIGSTVFVYAVSSVLENIVFASHPRLILITSVVTLFLLLMICYFECILAGTGVMGYIAAKTKPSLDKDFIIILGCSIDKRGGLLPLLKGRVNRAIRFAWEQEISTGKPMKYVPSGGQGPNEVMSEGSAMELYLLTRGAEDYEVFPEKKSKSTFENMAFSKKVIDEIKPDAKIAFATTNYHILRSGILARKAGFDAEGIAGDTKWYFWPNGFIREFFGILALNKKAHIFTALISALISIGVGIFAGIYGFSV